VLALPADTLWFLVRGDVRGPRSRPTDRLNGGKPRVGGDCDQAPIIVAAKVDQFPALQPVEINAVMVANRVGINAAAVGDWVPFAIGQRGEDRQRGADSGRVGMGTISSDGLVSMGRVMPPPRRPHEVCR